MIAIIMREFRDRKIALLAYALIGIGLLWVYIAIFPSIEKSAQDFEALYKAYPEALYKALGINQLSLNTLAKFLGIENFSFVWPILAIAFASSRAGNMYAGEIEKGRMGLFLSLPVSRTKIFFAKYTAGLAMIFVFVVLTVVSIIPLAALYSATIETDIIVRLTVISFLFAWVVYAIACGMSALFSERSRVYMITSGILFITYIMNVVASLLKNYEWLRDFSLFYYYDAQGILSGSELRISAIVVFSGIILFFTLLGMIIFNRRDITA